MRRIRLLAFIGMFCSLGWASQALASHVAFDAFTDFEVGMTGPFTIGDSPNSATFEGGDATVIGAPGLYVSGVRAFTVFGGGIGVITFETAASVVEFWGATQEFGNTTVTALDADNNVLASLLLSDQPMMDQSSIIFEGLGAIKTIVLDNSAAIGAAALDDFGYTVVPLPAAAWLFLSGMIGMFAVTRKRVSE